MHSIVFSLQIYARSKWFPEYSLNLFWIFSSLIDLLSIRYWKLSVEVKPFLLNCPFISDSFYFTYFELCYLVHMCLYWYICFCIDFFINMKYIFPPLVTNFVSKSIITYRQHIFLSCFVVFFLIHTKTWFLMKVLSPSTFNIIIDKVRFISAICCWICVCEGVHVCIIFFLFFYSCILTSFVLNRYFLAYHFIPCHVSYYNF